MTIETAAAPSAVKTPSRNLVLALLLAVYVLNFVDRQIVGILVEPIKADLGLSDREMGRLGGFAFALFYTTLGIPLAWAADRFSRRWIITLSLTVWSAMTALSGLAQNYVQLLIARMLVGVGEAGGGPPSQSMISDYFPPEERPRALGIWALGIPIGSALGVLLGAYVAANYGWRAAFFAAGAPGVVLAIVFAMVVKEPPRGRFDPVQKGAQPGVGATLAALVSKRTFAIVTLGAALASAVGYALFFWGAAYFLRRFDLDIETISYFTALVIGLAASLGTFMGGAYAAKLGARDTRFLLLIPAAGLLIAAPLNVVGLAMGDAVIAGLLFMVPTFFGGMWYGPLFGVVQNLVDPRMRAMAVAIMLFFVNLIGFGGITAVGEISEMLLPSLGSMEALRRALLVMVGVQAVAALVIGSAALTVRSDMGKAAS